MDHGLSATAAVHRSKSARFRPWSPICKVSPMVGCIAVEAVVHNSRDSRDTRGKWTSRPTWPTIGERHAFPLLWFRNCLRSPHVREIRSPSTIRNDYSRALLQRLQPAPLILDKVRGMNIYISVKATVAGLLGPFVGRALFACEHSRTSTWQTLQRIFSA